MGAEFLPVVVVKCAQDTAVMHCTRAVSGCSTPSIESKGVSAEDLGVSRFQSIETPCVCCLASMAAALVSYMAA